MLFQNILIFIEEYSSNFISPNFFSKLLNFDKIYLSDNLKDSKKIYSQLIRKYISLVLINNNEESFKLREVKKKKNIYSNNTEEEISDDIENYYINKNNRNISEISLHKILPINLKDIKKEKNQTDNLIY